MTQRLTLALRMSFAFSIFAGAASAADPSDAHWKKIKLSDQFYGEGANIGDFNHDGKMDVVSGPYWYEGPDFKVKHEYYPGQGVQSRSLFRELPRLRPRLQRRRLGRHPGPRIPRQSR